MYIKFQNFLEKFVGPIATKMAESKTIQSLSNGMMSVLPVTLGIAFIAIVGQLPIESWQAFLAQIGLSQPIAELINVTSSLYAIYIVVTIAYETAKIEECSTITSILLSLAVFLILVPQIQIMPEDPEGWPYAVIATSSLGSDGIFVAMMCGLLVTRLYAKLMNGKKLVLSLPESVPPMVSDSLSPTFVAMVIFIIAFIIKVVFNFSPWGDALTFVNTIVTGPVVALGTTPFAVVLIFTFANLLWFFGIHPAAIINIFYAITAPIYIANIEAFMAGQPQPYLEFMFMTSIIMIGGTGNTIGLAIDMLFAKSERFKSMRAMTFVPSIFNINEPLIFGVPVMLNPIFFLPLISSVIVGGLIIHVFYAIGFLSYVNPVIELPWTMPVIISNFIYGGLNYAIVMAVAVAAMALLYLPFFQIADKRAMEEEKANLQEVK